VEERTRPRPYALVYGPSVISATERPSCFVCLCRDIFCVSYVVRCLLGKTRKRFTSLFSPHPLQAMTGLDQFCHVVPSTHFTFRCDFFSRLTSIWSTRLPASTSFIPLPRPHFFTPSPRGFVFLFSVHLQPVYRPQKKFISCATIIANLA